MRVLLTGGAGFVGRSTAAVLVQRGHRVTVLDALAPQVHGPDAGLPLDLQRLVHSGSLEFVRGCVQDQALVASLLARAEGVVHLAALVSVGQSAYEVCRFTHENAVGAATIAEIIMNGKTSVGRLVIASSISSYGEGAGRNPRTGQLVAPVRTRRDLLARRWEPIDPVDGSSVDSIATPESFSLQPKSVYGLTKRYTEDLFRLLGEAIGLSVACLRYGNVYGPGQALSNPYTGVMCSFYARLQYGQPPLVFEDGGQRRCYTFVDDVALANALALEATFDRPTIMNISVDTETTLIALCRTLCECMRISIEPRLLGIARVGDVRHMVPNVRLAVETLGFRAKTPLTEGLLRWLDAITLEPAARDRTLTAVRELHEHGLLLGPLPADLLA